MNKILFLFFSFLVVSATVFAQHDFYADMKFSEADTLRGMLRPERTCFDVTFYDLNLSVDIEQKYISGYVDVYFKVTENFRTMQLDLFENMDIEQITFYDQALKFERKHNAVFVHLPLELPQNSNAVIRVEYSGNPTAAKNAPWDGGFVWKTDTADRPFVAVACEGDGASLWWPCKDHLSDEPDSMAINIAVANGLTCASNGNLRDTVQLNNGQTIWKWFVSYPINNYNVSINIANYAHFSDIYVAEDNDTLALDYYVLDYNLEKAKIHFEQVKPMLACYEKYMGKYPFWNDGFALIETPYLGMEHQSGIAYGNGYMRGYRGGMIPKDMDWDFIVIHESGHEYFGNSVSVTDHADMWIHESFTTYLEALYVECLFNYEDYLRYLDGQQGLIKNQRPIVGPRNVNYDDFGSSDHYFKGSWVLHTFRHAIGDDELFFKFFRAYYEKYTLQETNTAEFLSFVDGFFEEDYSAFWEQYLFYPSIPTLDYKLTQKGNDVKINYKWDADVKGFNMPVIAKENDKSMLLHPVNGELREFIFEDAKKEDIEIAKALYLIRLNTE